MQTRALGNDTVGRVEVGAVGLGLMTFDQTGHQPPEQLLDTVRAALDAGVTLFDTADAYGPGQELGPDAQGENEKLIASILDELGVRDRVLLATKGGAFRTQGGGWDHDGRPEHLHRAVDASLSRLGVEQIALWQHHRPDPKIDYAETIGALTEIAASGKVRMIGLSNADPGQIQAAHEALGDSLVSVQNQFSPKFRSSRPEIEVCTELGLAFLPWSPLGGLSDAKELATHHPAFQQVAEARGVSAQQVALAWELAQSPVVIPIPGAKRPQSILDSAAAADLELTPDELTALDEDRALPGQHSPAHAATRGTARAPSQSRRRPCMARGKASSTVEETPAAPGPPARQDGTASPMGSGRISGSTRPGSRDDPRGRSSVASRGGASPQVES